MTSSGTLRTVREFWASFGRLPLYDTGFGDAISQCGAGRADGQTDAIVAMAYLKGYADGARLACPYLEPSWRIAHLIGCAAGTFLVRLQDDGFNVVQAEKLCHTYTVELAELCRQKDSPMGRAVGGGA